MKRKVFIVAIVLVVFCACFYFYNNSSYLVLSKLPKNAKFSLGKLTYRVYLFGLFPVAQAQINFENKKEYQGREVYYLSASAESLKIISNLFYASASSESYINIEDNNPVFFRQKIIVKGKADVVKEARYDQKNGIMIINDVKREILPNTQDALSAIFNLRRMDFNVIKDFEIVLNTNQKNYVLKGVSELKDGLVLLKGDIRRKDKNNPYHRSQIGMVLLPEKGNLPVSIKVFASGILITAKLIKSE